MNKPEMYHRISMKFMPGEDELMTGDNSISEAINSLLTRWAQSMQKKMPSFAYRITNAEHAYIPVNPLIPGMSTTKILFTINIAYTV